MCVLCLLFVCVNRKTRHVDNLILNALKMGVIPSRTHLTARRKKAVTEV